ncbi:hypothetical protein [Sandaracinobacteroides hominis]|uniref:hypothetical protein n=1 Tax=Sandaracinobacteroides hominis TaxID=2780086 RepID=UPI0018F70A22|nr:hypothetical protein [Sandaracinobacteroides hominis]
MKEFGPPPPRPYPYPVYPVPVYPAWGWDPYWDWDDAAAGFAVGAATGAVVISAISSSASKQSYAVGTIVSTLPGGCTAVMVSNVAYQQCGGIWFRPEYAGTTLQYVVVNQPR